MKQIVLIVIGFLFAVSAVAQGEEVWELKKEEDGISVYFRDVEGSDFKEMKMTITLNTSLSSIIALFKDVDAYDEWVYLCESSRIVKEGDDLNQYYYSITTAPWPVSKRDVAVHSVIEQDPHTKIITSISQTMEGLAPEVDGNVRITYLKSVWTLIPLNNGAVHITYILGVDPGGLIPAWLANMTMSIGPYKTLIGMKEALKKDKYRNASYTFIEEL